MATEAQARAHVLLIYRELWPSIRLCGHSQMAALAGMGRIEYRHRLEQRLSQDDLRWADIVLLGRTDGAYEYRLAKQLKESGKYLVYIIDDDLLEVPEGIRSAKHYMRPEVQRSMRGMLELSDAVLSPSPILLKKYAANGKAPLLTREPAMNPVPYRRHDPEAPVRIGFAGSADRAGDVERLLSGALTQLKRVYGDRIQIEFFGFQTPMAEALDAKVRPYCASYDDYRRALNDMAWDIGLAPMPDTPFHACKHYNKFVEYAAAGLVGVFSEVEPYLQLKRDIGLGVFCENDTDTWVRALRALIDDREKLEKLRREVCECAQTTVSEETIARQLSERMADILTWRAPKNERRYPLSWWKLGMRLERYTLAMKIYGFSIFGRVLDKLRGRG